MLPVVMLDLNGLAAMLAPPVLRAFLAQLEGLDATVRYTPVGRKRAVERVGRIGFDHLPGAQGSVAVILNPLTDRETWIMRPGVVDPTEPVLMVYA